MKKPKISVVIPVYNGEKTLRKCLNSVLNQTYKNYEVIVVDNNSSDRTKEIIKEFEMKNKNLKYVFENYKSRGAARNAGVNSSKGNIIAMTDSDCIVSRDWVEGLVKPIIYENESVVMGFERDLIKNYWTKNIQKANWNLIKRNLDGKYVNHIDTKNFAIKSELIEEIMFDSKLNNFEDFDLYLRLKNKFKIRFDPSVIVGHYHKSSFMRFILNNFDRACWTKEIAKKHRNNTNLKNEVITESLSVKNFLIFPFWMALQFIKRPIGESLFIFVSEVSWRIGLIWGMIRK